MSDETVRIKISGGYGKDRWSEIWTLARPGEMSDEGTEMNRDAKSDDWKIRVLDDGIEITDIHGDPFTATDPHNGWLLRWLGEAIIELRRQRDDARNAAACLDSENGEYKILVPDGYYVIAECWPWLETYLCSMDGVELHPYDSQLG